MEHQPNLEQRRRLAEELAQAHLNVMACQERAAQSADQLVDAQNAMVQSIQRLKEAKEILEQINAVSWVQLNEED